MPATSRASARARRSGRAGPWDRLAAGARRAPERAGGRPDERDLDDREAAAARRPAGVDDRGRVGVRVAMRAA